MTTKAAESVDLSLTLFGGKDTSVKASDLPEGLSPANNDVIFGPGFVASRPCTSKVFGAAFPGNPRTVSMHEYLQANQDPLNIYLDSLGILRVEDINNSPGAYSTLGTVVPGSIMKAVTFDGVDYQVFSDGVHGIDIPRTYDGTNWNRLSQEGPAVAPTAADFAAVVNVAVNGIVPEFATVAISATLENTNTVTVTTAAPHGLFENEQISVQGVGVGGYNGIWSVLQVTDQFTFTYFNPTASLGASSGGTVRPTSVQLTTTTPHGMIAGAQFTIAGTSAPVYNNNVAGVNPSWTVQVVISSTVFIFVPGVNPVNSSGGTVQVGGQITAGGHGVVVFFITESDYFTKPSPTGSWNAAGGRQVQLTNVPIGPSNVIARGIAFTGTGGANYFHIPTAATGAMATIIPDNTTTSITLDFADNTLFAAEGIDIPGNNLFALVTLAPCLGIDAYASRIFAWGEFNKVQGFLNMGFEGGTATVGGTTPLGWTAGAGGALVSSPADFGLAWQITGDGTANARGQLSQTAFQNYLNQPILSVNTPFTFYVWAKASAAGPAGNLIATLSSASTGFTSTATIPANTIPNANGAFVNANFTLPTPATIPSDLVLSIFAKNLPNGATLDLDEMMLIFTAQPYRDTVGRGSYANNPESFDGVTGNIGPASDPNPIRDTFQLLEQLTFLTSERRHVTRDNDGEPGTWEVDQVETKVGAASVHSTTTGPNWAMWLSDNGKSLSVRITSSGESYKISREMKTDFGAVNMAAKQKAWLTNVDDDSRVYAGLPQGNNTTPSVLAVLDYFESDTAQDISGNRPLHIGYTGKMLTTDLGRKWTIWNLPMDCGEVMPRPNGLKEFVVGSGAAIGGPGPFGNAYTFDPLKLTDDDYGGMLPSYTTYFFINHEMEQQLPVGTFRKLYSALTTFITGTGMLRISPHVNIIGNIPKNIVDLNKQWALTNTQADDIEWTGLDVAARRMAIQVYVLPLPGTTDVQFVLSHMGVRLQKHPVSPQSGINKSYA